jgi:uncharacterized membrane protein YdjX (TVP38/TMEM64 family)
VAPERFEALLHWIQAQGALAPAVYIVVYAAATVFCIPGSVLTLLAGSLFGTWFGLICVVIGANLGANLAFLVARKLGRQAASRLLRGKLPQVEVQMDRNGFTWVFWLRLVPLVPFFALNYACGLTPVRWSEYAAATFLGMIPACFVFVSLGALAGKAAAGKFFDPRVWQDPAIWIMLVVIVGLAFVTRKLTPRLRSTKKDP